VLAHRLGDREAGGLRLDFARRRKLAFLGSRVPSDAGPLPFRARDAARGLTATAGDRLVDPGTGKNGQHGTVGLFRHSTFGRRGGDEDVTDAGRLGHDPAMRWIVGGHAIAKRAAAASQMGRFESGVLATGDTIATRAARSGTGIAQGHDRRPPKEAGLDKRHGRGRPGALIRPGLGGGGLFDGWWTSGHAFRTLRPWRRCTLRAA
jgi:hypothetical protein